MYINFFCISEQGVILKKLTRREEESTKKNKDEGG